MGMLWKIQKICSKMGTKIFEIDEEMPEIIDAKVSNPQNSTTIKSANLSQPWNLTFFQDYIFKKFCAHCAANFLNFPKHPHNITFWWFWRKLWPKIRKLRNQKICQFEPTLKSSLFSGWKFSTFFSSLCPKSTKVKNRPYLTVKRAQKH